MKFQRITYRTFSFFSTIRGFALVTALALLTAQPVAIAEDSAVSDFGSETIETETPASAADVIDPLPLDLVEERGGIPMDLRTIVDADDSPSTDTSDEPKADDVASPVKSPVKLRGSLDQSTLEEETTVLNVNDVELTALIKTFSKITRRNYIVDSAVKGKVTIHLPTPVTLAEALRIFDTVLLLKGFTTVPVEANTWKVIPAKDAKQTTIPLVGSERVPASDALVTKMIRLRHLASGDMEQILTPFVSKDGVMKAVAGSNALLVIDSQSNLARLERIASELDVPALDQEITIIPILYAEANDIAEKINEILGEEENEKLQNITTRNTRTRRNRNLSNQANRNKQANQQTSQERRSLPLKIIPDERTNSLIVVADPELTIKVRALSEQLDSELDRSSGRFYVYSLKHADAEALSEILNNLISGAGNSDGPSGAATSGSSISRSNARTGATNAATQRNISRNLAQSRNLLRRSQTQTGAANSGRVTLEGEVSIAADPSTNSLIINASRTDYLRIKEVVDALDMKRRQVLVEATLLEVTLSDEESLGVELQGTAGGDDGGVVTQTNFGGLTNLLTNPAGLSDFTLAAASSGTLTLPGGLTIPSQAILISAVSAHQNVNVLSSPTILATDNEEAEIIVGENVPFVSSTQTDSTNINTTFNNIERQDVGITLRITPQISTGEFVILKIFVEISNVVNGTRNDPNGPTTTIRTTETTVEVKNNQMIVTGGLIQDSQNDSSRGVPYLMDVPVIGNWFKTEAKTNRRTNLLVFITPRVISNQYEARDETVELVQDLRREIELTDARPSREEVLANSDIDNVIEKYNGKDERHPTTIRPARAAFSKSPPSGQIPRDGAKVHLVPSNKVRRTETTKRAGDTAETNSSIIFESDVLDITVAPTLPGASATLGLPGASATLALPGASATLGSSKGGNSKANTSTASLAAKSKSPKTFVVLKSSTTEGGTKALVLVGSGKQSFFQVGREYLSDRGERYVCLGRYAKRSEAAIVHQDLATVSKWQELSAAETLTLGTKGWRAL